MNAYVEIAKLQEDVWELAVLCEDLVDTCKQLQRHAHEDRELIKRLREAFNGKPKRPSPFRGGWF